MAVSRIAIYSLALSLSLPLVGGADVDAEKKRKVRAKAPKVEKTGFRVRNSAVVLGRTRPKTKRVQQAVSRQVKGDIALGGRKGIATSPKVAVVQNPYDRAVAELTQKAATLNPKLSGRLEISFVVGRNGEPGKCSLFGLDAQLDAQLLTHLKAMRFPKADAGMPFWKRVTISRQASKAKLKATSKAKRSRKTRKRKRSRRTK